MKFLLDYVMRSIKLLGVAFLTGYCILDYLALFEPNAQLPQAATDQVMKVAIVVGITGLYNAGAVGPSKMLPTSAKLWRVVIYFLKFPLWLALSPLLEKTFPDINVEQVKLARASACVLITLLSVAAKSYREKHQKPINVAEKAKTN
jgi:hypothetical protein